MRYGEAADVASVEKNLWISSVCVNGTRGWVGRPPRLFYRIRNFVIPRQILLAGDTRTRSKTLSIEGNVDQILRHFRFGMDANVLLDEGKQKRKKKRNFLYPCKIFRFCLAR